MAYQRPVSETALGYVSASLSSSKHPQHWRRDQRADRTGRFFVFVVDGLRLLEKTGRWLLDLAHPLLGRPLRADLFFHSCIFLNLSSADSPKVFRGILNEV